MSKKPYILGICAANSGSGKTFVIEKLIPELKKRGYSSSAIKHAHHNFDIDSPGKDSYRLRKSGAFQTLIFNNKRSALITEYTEESESLEKMIAQMDQGVDLIIVEGLRGGEFKKIEVYRPAHSKKKLFLQDEDVIAIVSDEQFDASVPCLNLNNIEEISHFIISNL